jgi:hypothetical protein
MKLSQVEFWIRLPALRYSMPFLIVTKQHCRWWEPSLSIKYPKVRWIQLQKPWLMVLILFLQANLVKGWQSTKSVTTNWGVWLSEWLRSMTKAIQTKNSYKKILLIEIAFNARMPSCEIITWQVHHTSLAMLVCEIFCM